MLEEQQGRSGRAQSRRHGPVRVSAGHAVQRAVRARDRA